MKLSVKPGYFLYFMAPVLIIYLLWNSFSDDRDAARKRVQDKEQQKIEDKKRYEAGSFVAEIKNISDHETMKKIIYPQKMGNDYSEDNDTTCIVYSNADLKTSSMRCYGVMVDDGSSQQDSRE